MEKRDAATLERHLRVSPIGCTSFITSAILRVRDRPREQLGDHRVRFGLRCSERPHGNDFARSQAASRQGAAFLILG